MEIIVIAIHSFSCIELMLSVPHSADLDMDVYMNIDTRDVDHFSVSLTIFTGT